MNRESAFSVAANVLTILLVLATGWVLLSKTQARSLGRRSEIRSSVPVAVDPAAERTLFLVLSPVCHFCTANAELYRGLAADRRRGVRLVAALPTNEVDGRAYLDSLGIKVDAIVQRSAKDFGSPGTPALILADRSGAVLKSWIGQVRRSADREELRREVCKP